MEADGSITVTGSKTEGALFKLLDVLKLKSADKYTKVVEVPFTSDRKVGATRTDRAPPTDPSHARPQSLTRLCVAVCACSLPACLSV